MRAEHGREAPVLTGLRVGGVAAVCVAALAVVGLTPFFSWVPETPLVLTAVLIPMLGYGLAGYRSASLSRRALDGVIAGLVAGVVSGGVGGCRTSCSANRCSIFSLVRSSAQWEARSSAASLRSSHCAAP